MWLLLLLTGAGYTWNLTANGWGNGFYAAAAQAGADNWTAFLFGSSDIGNSITVDKPPASIWPMALSVKLFGLSSFSVLFPEVLMGVASVGLVYASVARAASRRAGLLAGYVLALTPVAALMFRYDNPEALMLLLMSLAAYATVRAIESGRIRWMVLCGAALGFAFLTKQFQGLLVVPGFGLAYLLLAASSWKRRLVGLAAALVALVVSAGWWVALVMLTPADQRPYIGGSQTNSFWDLTFGYNGLGRISGDEVGSVGGGATASPTMFRMFDSSFGGQISWLMPAAIVLGAAALWITRRAARTDLRRAVLVVWGSWFLVTWVVFSIMQGIQHEYYSVALAPAIAVLVGLGASVVWDAGRAARYFADQTQDVPAHHGAAVAEADADNGVTEHDALGHDAAGDDTAGNGAVRHEGPVMVTGWREALGGGTWQFAVLGFTTVLTGVWAFILLGRAEWMPVLRWAILFLSVIAGTALVFAAHLHRQLVALAVAGAVLAGLAGPSAYTVATISTGHSGSIVSAGPGGGGMGGAAPGGQGGQGGGQAGGPGSTGQGGSAQAGTAQGGSTQGGASQDGSAQGSGGQAAAGTTDGAGQDSTGQASSAQAGTQSDGGGMAMGGAMGMGGVGTMLNTSSPSQTLVDYLSQDAGNYRWMLAVVGSNQAAGYQLASGHSVMPVGGYNGTDPAPTLAEFQALVAQGQIHYYVAGTISSGGTSSGSDDANQIDEWVQAHFASTTVDGTVVYDLTQSTD